MIQWTRAGLLLLLSLAIAACVNQRELRKREIQRFLQTSAGEYVGDAGEVLFMAPVYARMIGFDTMYLERSTPKGTSARLLALEPSPDSRKILQFAYAFTQPAQWREVRAQPELLSALQPNDVRPAGTCDIQLADDLNSVSYTCGGSPVQSYRRVHHPIDE